MLRARGRHCGADDGKVYGREILHGEWGRERRPLIRVYRARFRIEGDWAGDEGTRHQERVRLPQPTTGIQYDLSLAPYYERVGREMGVGGVGG